MASFDLNSVRINVPTNVKLKVDERGFFKSVMAAAGELLKKKLANDKSLQEFILVQIKEIMIEEFYQSPTVKSLLSDGEQDLRSQFGLTNELANTATKEIITYLTSKVKISVGKFVFNNIKNPSVQFNINLLPTTFTELVSSIHAAEYVSTKSGEWVPWLQWLLESGNAPVVSGYRIKFASGFKRNPIKGSRTGLSLMLETQSTVFTVPPLHSGTEQENFITRAFAKIPKSVEKIVLETIKGAFV